MNDITDKHEHLLDCDCHACALASRDYYRAAAAENLITAPAHVPGAGNMVVDEYKIQDRSISAAQNYCRNLWGTARGRSDWANFHDAFRAGFLEASTRPPQQSAQPVAWRYRIEVQPRYVAAQPVADLRPDPKAVPAPQPAWPSAQPAIAWRCHREGLKRFMTQEQYEAQGLGVKTWYEPYKCASCLGTAQPVEVQLVAIVSLIEECRDALAEELAGWDLDPPLHHVKQAHDKCVEWLARNGIKPASEGGA